jgi:ligand-binding sensor domain-containing protein/two-component sensor histidine kinase
MAKLVISFFLSILPFGLLAQFSPNADWRFENFNSQNHFTSREILNLAMDKHGYIWTCSRGVQRFDGYKTIDFNSLNPASGGLRDNSVDITADKSGRIWISSAGLCYYDNATNKFIYVDGGRHKDISMINGFLQQNNFIWFVCNYGLARLNLNSLKITYTSLTEIADPLITFLVDSNTLLVSSREKVYIYNIQKDTYSSCILTYNNTLLKIFAVAKNGSKLFLGTNNGLFVVDDIKNIHNTKKVMGDFTVNDMLFLRQDKEKNHLLLATEGNGIMVYNTVLKKLELNYVHDNSNPGGLSANIINKFYVDTTGRLWVSTASGASMLDINNQQWKIRFLDKINADELNISQLAIDKYDRSKFWMSSYSNGMIRMDWRTKKIEKIYDVDLETRKVYDFVQLTKNKWLLVTQKKIIEWDPEGGVLSEKKLPVPDSLGLVCDIRRIIVAGDSSCFITTNKGLFEYNLFTHKITIVSKAKATANPYELLKYDLLNGFYDGGVLWIASRNGLFSYNKYTHKTIVYTGQTGGLNNFLFDVANAGNGKVACASGGGLTIFDQSSKSFKIINLMAGFYKPDCVSVTCVNNVIWIDSEAGILKYDMNTGKSTQAEQENPVVQIFPGSPFKIIDNDIVIGFRNGYAYFQDDLKNASIPSAPVIEAVSINNEPLLLHFSSNNDSQNSVFDHSENSVNIAFTAFLYTDPDYINFRYRLKGADSRWLNSDGQRNANYLQLPPGDYTFLVQSGNKSGFWNNQTASFSFIIRPPYWATWWFRTLIVFALAFGLYAIYNYRVNHLLAIERIRERIASDFHDDIGSALSSISIFSEVADKQLKQQLPNEQTRQIIAQIAFQSRAMLEAVDDIIWLVNPQNDHFNDLAIRMREFAIPLLEAKNIGFVIDIDENMFSSRLKMDARKNIFLIFKECVNNIIKHSGATEIIITLNKINNQLALIIADNGKGFDTAALNNRNGLKNMARRANEIKGNIQITSQPDSGTIIKLLVNII